MCPQKTKVGVFIITLVAFICYFQKTRKAKKMRELSNLGFKKNFDWTTLSLNHSLYLLPNHVLDLLGDLVRHHVHLLAGHHLNKYLSSAQSPVPTLHSRKSETMTNQPTYQLTGVGARDTFTSKNKKSVSSKHSNWSISDHTCCIYLEWLLSVVLHLVCHQSTRHRAFMITVATLFFSPLV